MNNSELRLLRYLFIDQFVVKRGVKKEQQTTAYAEVTEKILNLSSPSPASPFEENITYTVFDLETTGFYPHMGDEILSIGAVKVKDGQVLESERFYEVVKPFGKVSSFIKKLTGLTEKELENGITFSEALTRFLDFIEDTVLVAHPAAFDVPFIQTQAKVWKLPPIPLTYIDSRGLAFALKKEKKIALDDLLKEYELFSHSRHHALNDALMTGFLFLELQKHPSLAHVLKEEELHWYIRKES